MVSFGNFKFTRLLLGILTLMLLCHPVAAEEADSDVPDFSGRWKVHMRNDLGWKTCTFDIEQEDGRLRGEVLITGVADEVRLDGKFLEDNKVQLWAKYRDGRTGASSALEFKGVYEGEPGNEIIKGEAEYFDKYYDFTAKRAKKKK